MQHDITKLCADSLRAFILEKYGVKLKASHAHELGAAFFGYPSKNAMLADTKYPVSNLDQAQIIIMVPDAFIDQRRKDLKELSPELPDSYALYVHLPSAHPQNRGHGIPWGGTDTGTCRRSYRHEPAQ